MIYLQKGEDMSAGAEVFEYPEDELSNEMLFIDDVARRLGVGKATVYNYINDETYPLTWNPVRRCTTRKELNEWLGGKQWYGGIPKATKDDGPPPPEGTYHRYGDGTYHWIDDDGHVIQEGRWRE